MRTLGRVATILLVTLLVLALGLVLSVPLDRAITAGRVDGLTNVSYPASQADAPPVAAYRADPEGEGPHPAVVMIHEFWGLRADIAGKADALADLGYVVVAPDTFRGTSVNWVPSAIWNIISTPAENIDADLRTVVDALAADPTIDATRIVVMGFCYGGGAALRYSLSDPRLAGTGVFYGTLITEPDRLETLPGPLLGIFGEEDAQIPMDEVLAFERALQETDVPHELYSWPGVGHAFVGSVEEIAEGGPPAEAWSTFTRWLEDVTATTTPTAP